MKKKFNFDILVIVLLGISVLAVSYFFLEDYSYIYIYCGLFSCGIFLSLTISMIITNTQRKKVTLLEEKLGMWNSISYRVKRAGESAFNKMPLGIIVFNDEFEIEWANNYAKEVFSSALVERKIENLSKELQAKLDEHKEEFTFSLYGKIFSCKHSLRDRVLYLTDITKEHEVLTKYKLRTLALGILNLDNLDQSMSTLDAQTKALHMSKIIGILTEWADQFNIYLKGYSEERYLLIMDRNTLDNIVLDKISIVDKIKSYCEKEELRITGSVGIACDDLSATDLFDVASEQLNLALSRGGSQAIVKINGDKPLYFGAQGEAFEGRTPTQIRYNVEELLDLISKYSKVYIMAHKSMDADAFGACLAATKLCDSRKVESHIVFSEELVDTSVKNIYHDIQTLYQNVLPKFVDPKQAAQELDDNSLLILVDCQYTYLIMDEKVYKRAKHVAIVDHHRRNAEAINNYEYIYSQPSASSSVELIMEMLEYVDKKLYEISSIEATWMIMGILVDTNNYMIHTTSNTFAVLSTLQSYGSEMAKVQRYLREDYEKYTKKIDILDTLEIVDNYGIVVCDDQIYERSFMAKVADNVITINNVKAAFCIGRFSETGISISARSLDEENVQVLMEKLGGGGHYTTAATQLYNVTLEEAKAQLLAVLKKNSEEGDKSMKIILIKDVKGKGKVNDVIECPSGYANYLMRNGSAIEASPANLRQLENNKALEKEKEEKFLEEMKELKVKIESMVVKVAVKVGANGKLFGSVSTKEIVEKFKEQNKIELDKRKIMLEETIDALGVYDIPIQLHKEVTANIKLHVIEEVK